MRKSILLLAAAALAPLFSSGLAHAQTFAVRLRAELELRTPEGRPGGALPLTSEHLRAEIDGQHATTTLRQVFSNTTSSVVEGRYVLRTELGARVTGFAYYIGEERIVGEVLERNVANQVYDEVTQARRDPAILEQTAEGEVTFRVFPIQPAENKRIEITFSEWLARRGQSVTYRVPLSSPSAEAEILLTDPRARDVRSTTHRIEVEPVPGGLRVRTRGALDAQGAQRSDGSPAPAAVRRWRDAVTQRSDQANPGELSLRWRVEEQPWQVSAYVHRDLGHAAYFALSLAAPEGSEDAVSPKDVTLVLDRSGSMSGAAIEHARRAAMDVIRRLGPADRLNVIAFDDDVDPLYARPRPADPQTRSDALGFVGNLRDGGGTDLAFALRRALESQHDAGGRPRVVIFLTDGQSAPEPVLELAQADRRDVRVFTVGVGSGVNRPLLARLAADKRGRFMFIADARHIEAEVGHLYAQIARPLLVDVSLDVEGGAVSRVYPRSLPDLFVDDELRIHGRLRADGPVAFVLRGRLGDRQVEIRTGALIPASVERPWVGRQWAVARVDDLLADIQLKGEDPERRAEVITLALAYDFVTPYTAFLAIPERELTAQAAQTLAGARAERMSAQAHHLDAAALRSSSTVIATPGFAAGGVEAEEAMPMAAPSVDARAYRAGCASCSIGAPRRSAGLLGGSLVIGLLALRRLRRGARKDR